MDNIIELIGYHATHIKNKDSILKNGFKISNEEYEWLGHGIYFFENKIDAETWNDKISEKNRYIFKCLLKCNNIYFLNLDNPENTKKITEHKFDLMDCLKKENISLTFGSKTKERCFVLNSYKEKYNIEITKYTFKNNRTIKRMKINYLLFDSNEVQLCVKDNSFITVLQKGG